MKRIVLLVAFITATLIQAQNTTPTTTIKSWEFVAGSLQQ